MGEQATRSDGDREGPRPAHIPALLADMVEQVRACAAGSMWAMPEAAIPMAVEHAHALAEAAVALVTVLTGEAVDRGLPAADGLSVPDWLSAHADGVDRRSAAAISAVAPALRQPRWETLGERVRSGAVSVGKAARIVRFEQDVSPVADAEHLAAVVDSLVEHAATLDDRQIGRLVARARTTLRPPAETERLERVQRAGRAFTKVGACAGMVEYRLRLDPEGAALLDAAIDPLARPRPDLGWDGGERRDPRSAPCRRADALLELVGRAMADPEGATRTEKTTLVVNHVPGFAARPPRGSGRGDQRRGPVGRHGATPRVRRRDRPGRARSGRRAARAGPQGEAVHTGTEAGPPSATEDARSRGARSPRSGPMPTMCGTGVAVGPQTSPTRRCCAPATTPWSTTAT